MFTHLHAHTEFSLLDGANKITEYVSRVKALGMDAAAITDHGVMYGVVDFYRAAKNAGIKPILGCEVYVAPGSRFDRDPNNRYYHLVLLAENNTGYANLIKIVSRGFTEGFYFKPRVDMEVLEEYHEGIIALSACIAGEIPKLILRNQYDKAKETALRYEACFGKGNFFLEMQDHGLSQEKIVNEQLLRLHEETGIGLVCSNDVHYTFPEDAQAHDILLCIQTGKKLKDKNRLRYGAGYHVTSEMDFPFEAVENTGKIAERCNVEIEFGVPKLPVFKAPMPSFEYLRSLCFDGLKKLYPDPSSVEEQLNYELGVIQKMGYVDYFLIVWDFVRFARENNIPVGPGRGSAAGSLVAYTLGITQLDPIRYGLLFERFLNPERVSMPDIDVDFCYERRQEVIDYVVDKYGKDCVAQISTLNTLAARNAIRDVGRVMGLSYSVCDATAKLIPEKSDIETALQVSADFKAKYDSDPDVREMINMARRLEGIPRHASTHPAGVVICDKSVDEYVPLSLGSDGVVVAQFSMTTLEELGLLKMDFLGLRTLTVIKDTLDSIKDTVNIDYNDRNVFDSLCTGRTDGVFQLESRGMQKFMKELQPHSLEDLIAGISLFRPGPMDFIPSYLENKNHPEKIIYSCPQLEPILSSTYGCIVYQEQVMRIVRDLAGYSLGRSDLVRRAMAKKKPDVMEKERRVFVYGSDDVPGCVSRGIPEDVANHIFDEMTDFAKYAFNKSHAAAYALLSYQTAFLKYYYPVEFMAAFLTSCIDKPAKTAEYIQVCRQMGIRVLPPDINKSQYRFSVSEGSIRYALSAVKGVGRSFIDASQPEFCSFEDFISRIPVNVRTAESLIKAGAFDCFGHTRKHLLSVCASLLKNKSKNVVGQMSLFDFDVEDEFDRETLLAMEKEVLGVYASGHPLEIYEDLWRKVITNVSTDLTDGEVVVGGIISSLSIKYTKQGKRMAVMSVDDLYGSMEVVVYPKVYDKFQNSIFDNGKVFIKGTASENKIICSRVCLFENVELWVCFDDYEDYKSNPPDKTDFCPGSQRAAVYLKKERAIKYLPFCVLAYNNLHGSVCFHF